jgi:L-arabinokinase
LLYSRSTEDFEILHGDPQGFPDTICFLKSLAELDAVYETEKNAEKRQMREQKAAAGLFNWEVFLISTKVIIIIFTSPALNDLSQ